MAVSIFLIYKLCHFFSIEIKWSSLVFCAVMAFIVNGAAISMSPFLDRAHYLRLGILVITAAAAVTIFNERLLRREEAVAGNYTSLATEILAPEDMPAPPPEEKLAAETPSPAPADGETTTPADPAVAARLAAKQEAEEAVRAAEALAAEKAAAEKAAAEKAAAEKAAAEKAAAEKAAHQQELQAKLGSMNSLDDILDFAYATKDQQPQDAIFAYQEAIARFSDDDYMPFLIIELGNLYKEQADYRGAVATYAKAMHLPIIADNDAMRQEFAKNIRYLGVVQDILAKHSALSTPFPQIPGSIMQEIETEFQSQNDRAAN
jgi:colicin import membrane protein